MNILACDVGLKHIGLAVYMHGIILPLEAIIRINRNQAARDLDKLLKEREIERLVVGLPSGGWARHEEGQRRIRHFISLLCFEGEIIFIDEDYTSIEALESLGYMKVKTRARAQKNGMIDSLSACIILERYIESYLS
ncbi:Holliday junction resolvase RuvX [Helicobacter marmotae]|uniref:Putative pre-16S rRNA nuclease n=1 Tax=Helicobacter marmotae TaxID=152490 RepID=A0A3D8I723_9HELI|nr:Holliday junction resolvase RuvX [Helicobacter marmotae]RDU60331.1 Holliday junction resolvase RuvX [Helicobacter marmotae]